MQVLCYKNSLENMLFLRETVIYVIIKSKKLK
ncbi:hypothetical protein SPPR111872_14770 [Sphingobacterium prati]